MYSGLRSHGSMSAPKMSCETRKMHHGLDQAVGMDSSVAYVEIGCYAILAFHQVIAPYVLLLCFCIVSVMPLLSRSGLFILSQCQVLRNIVFYEVIGFQG